MQKIRKRSASWLAKSARRGFRGYAVFAAAAVVLFAYGFTVNAPPWDFGKLLGLYVVFFFVIAQLISWLFFKQTPSPMVLLGGLLIVAGGIVISFAKA